MFKLINNINKSYRIINYQLLFNNKKNYNNNIKFYSNNKIFNNILNFTTTTPITTTTNVDISTQNIIIQGSSTSTTTQPTLDSNNNNNNIEEKKNELIKLISENYPNNCIDSILNLCNLIDNQEILVIPFKSGAREMSQFDLMTLVVSMDKTNLEALEYITQSLLGSNHHGVYLYDIDLYNAEYLTFRRACELFYKTCNASLPNSISNIILSINGCQTYNFEDGTTVSIVDLLLEGISKFPTHFPFMTLLSSYIKSNNYYIKLPSDADAEIKLFNKFDLLKKDTENENLPLPYLSLALFEIGSSLKNKKETIKLFADDQIFTKQTALAKAIELAEGVFDLQLMYANLLVKSMNVDDRVIINGESLSRIGLLETLFFNNDLESSSEKLELINLLNSLSKFYKLDKNFKESDRYKQLAEIENENYKSYLIKSIEETKLTTVNCVDYAKHCHILASKVLKNDETVSFCYDPIPMQRVDLAKFAVDHESLCEDYHCTYAKIMLENKIYSDNEDCQSELLKEFQVSPHNPNAYHLLIDIVKINGFYNLTSNISNSYLDLMNLLFRESATTLPFQSESEIPNKNLILTKIYSRLISLEPEEPDHYLQLGIYLKEEGLNQSNLITLPINPVLDRYFIIKQDENKLSYTRKELFSKFIELKYQTDSINGVLNSEALGWYHLSLEMNNDEVQFGKTKKEILLNIINNIDSTFTKAMIALSDLIEIDDDNEKIQLLVRAITNESDLFTKSSYYTKLASILIDNDQTVELNNGINLNKKQLLIESIETYPRKNHSTSLKLLANTLNNSNDDTVLLFGQYFNKTQLLESYLKHLELSNSKADYLETFKIKSNIILNKFNDFF